jgi:hypothetical protein
MFPSLVFRVVIAQLPEELLPEPAAANREGKTVGRWQILRRMRPTCHQLLARECHSVSCVAA